MATDAERIAILETEMEDVKEGVANFKAFQKRASTFFDTHDAEVATEKRLMELHHEENKEKLDRNNFRIAVFGAIIAVFSLICAACMVYLAVKAASHAKNDPSDLFRSDIPRLTAER